MSAQIAFVDTKADAAHASRKPRVWSGRPDREHTPIAQRCMGGAEPDQAIQLVIAWVGQRPGAVVYIKQNRIKAVHGRTYELANICDCHPHPHIL